MADKLERHSAVVTDMPAADRPVPGADHARRPGRTAAAPRPMRADERHVPVIIVGAGQAGMSVGYHLKRRGIPFLILDANARVGDQWRRRWDSLRLFTPARYDALDGMAFPSRRHSFPTKDEMGAFLESFANRFDLPIENGVRVDGLRANGGGFAVSAGERRWNADQVVVAMSNFQEPKVPAFAAELDAGIVQLHSSEYRNPGQLADGDTLIVGAGNSGAEIAKEVVMSGHRTFISGRHPGHIPFRVDGFLGRHLLVPLVLRVIFLRILTTSTPMGRRARRKALANGEILIRVKPKHLARLGIERVARVVGTDSGRPRLQDGRVIDAANVIWCTGYRPGFDWIRLPSVEGGAIPTHRRGVVAKQPGLYFTGLRFLYAMSSIMIQGAGRDARYIAKKIAARARRHA